MFGLFRTLLAFMVVAQHLGGVPMIGAYAVFGFYCLSGFLMTLILQSRYGYSLRGFSSYAINRFLRIYPMYWLSIMFTLILIVVLGNDFTQTYHSAMSLPQNTVQWFQNIFLYFPSLNSPRLTPPAWALTVELCFYILIGLGLSKTKSITVIWFVLSVLYHAVALFFHWGWEHRYFTVPAASLPFATGAMIYHFKRELLVVTEHIFSLLGRNTSMFLLAGLLANWLMGYLTNLSETVFFYSNFLFCAALVIVLMRTKELPFINASTDKWFGNLSYPVYLMHYQIGLVLVVIFDGLNIEMTRPDLLLLFISVPVITLLSWIVSVNIEKPIEVLRDRIKRR